MGKAKLVIGIITLFIAIIFLSTSLMIGQSNNPHDVYYYTSASSSKQLVVIQLNEEIDPGSAAMITGALSGLNHNNTAAVVICMNTPGGLLTSMIQIVSAINSTEAAHVPVYTYILPESLGASAGSYIAMATDQIWMGPGSEIGPSTPIVEGGSALQENHTLNGMAGLMMALAEAHGRNVTAAAEMVYKDQVFSYEQAYQIGLINGISSNFTTFLSTNNLSMYNRSIITESIFDQLMSFFSNATVDGLFISLGSLAILLDLYHGTILLTAVGIIMIVLGLLGAQLIDASLVGIVMLILGSVLVLLEFKTAHGIALMSGIAVDIFGTFLLVSPNYDITSQPYSGSYSPSPVSGDFIITGIAVFVIGGFIAYYLHKIIGSQARKPVTGWESLVNATGVADTDIDPDGWVSIDGVKWKAVSRDGKRIDKGKTITVIGMKNLTLTVAEKGDGD
ncbi:MAG: nodulation protein NfeD [Candidatus Thermoplasmatota archaeon]|nr:nodulation protein NfeD [Candidatus Thermoplasmatota archaeon]